MEKEVSGVTMFGIVLLALAVLIGLGFGVFAIAKSTANEGVTQVQDNLAQVNESIYTDYDQKVVTGTQVTSSYNTFEGKPVAVLIATQASKNIEDTDDPTAYEGAGTKELDNVTPGKLPFVIKAYQKAADKSEPGDAYTTTTSDGTEVELCFMNYNAVLLGSFQSADAVAKIDSAMQGQCGTQASSLYFDGGTWRVNAGFGSKNSKVLFNTAKSNLTKTGMMEFIPSSGKFQANLVKDATGTIMGVAFEQIGGK